MMIKKVITSLFVFSIIFITATYTKALPQFPARHGYDCKACHEDPDKALWETPPWYARKCALNCAVCHVNPTGGGMRNAVGNYFASYTLPISPLKEEGKPEPIFKDFREATQLSRYISFGGDFRFAYLHSGPESTSRFRNTFFPMQADLYVNFTPTDQLLFYYMQGLQGNKEVFGLLHDLYPANIYLKFGRFIPPYGLKIDDHTAFIRDRLDLGLNKSENADIGIETGFSTFLYFLNMAIFNGNGNFGPDDNSGKAFSGTGGIRARYASFGLSYYYNDSPDIKKVYYGMYGTLHYWRLTYLGEMDKVDKSNDLLKTRGIVYYNELDYSVSNGAILKVKYEYYNPEQVHRFSYGIDLYPYPNTEISLLQRMERENPDIDNDQTLLLFHLYF